MVGRGEGVGVGLASVPPGWGAGAQLLRGVAGGQSAAHITRGGGDLGDGDGSSSLHPQGASPTELGGLSGGAGTWRCRTNPTACSTHRCVHRPAPTRAPKESDAGWPRHSGTALAKGSRRGWGSRQGARESCDEKRRNGAGQRACQVLGQMHVQSDTRVQTWAHTCTHTCIHAHADSQTQVYLHKWAHVQTQTCTPHVQTHAHAHPHGLQWGPGQRPSPSTTLSRSLSRPCPLPPSGSGRCFPEQWGRRLPPSPAPRGLWHHLRQGQATEPGQNCATCFACGHRAPQSCARLPGVGEGAG
ncbi:HAUS augmin-like complex subunit 3 [Platysternon megacephalum]|uniref:HAUS augmin-like complex subunit 3 n=1 Tax=Platysternon megacephalum TaxID=55544 RepID=A0A4D9EKS5_9SAUR|nr:HAUS augmin-like complex subunit 3 [Platysternon megacephalum]